MVNPGMPEIPCDNIDNNCSGLDPDDEFILPPPLPLEIPFVRVRFLSLCNANFGRPIFWYGSATGNDLLAFGECYSPDLPINKTSIPETYTFSSQKQISFVFRNQTPVEIIVNPRPGLLVSNPPEICPGDSIILNSLNIIDTNFTGGRYLISC